MTELKTKPNDKNVKEFLNKVENQRRREDSFEILKIMQEITKEEPIMWGESIVGFGSYHYKYASGREADWLAHKAGLYVPCTLHDALYLEHDYGDWEAIDKLVECMREGFAKFFPENYEIARKIKLDPFTWGPDLPKSEISLDDKGKEIKTYHTITTPNGLTVDCADIYVDERAVDEYNKFSKFFNQGEESVL